MLWSKLVWNSRDCWKKRKRNNSKSWILLYRRLKLGSVAIETLPPLPHPTHCCSQPERQPAASPRTEYALLLLLLMLFSFNEKQPLVSLSTQPPSNDLFIAVFFSCVRFSAVMVVQGLILSALLRLCFLFPWKQSSNTSLLLYDVQYTKYGSCGCFRSSATSILTYIQVQTGIPFKNSYIIAVFFAFSFP